MLDEEKFKNLGTNLNVDEKGLRKILYMGENRLGRYIKYGSERVRQFEIKY